MSGPLDPNGRDGSGSTDPVFGLDDAITRSEAKRLHSQLQGQWQYLYGDVGDLESDLHRLRRLFDPVAQGGRLRRELGLIEGSGISEGPGPPLSVRVDDRRWLVTPEGRCALALLGDALASQPADLIFIGDEDRRPFEQALLLAYRRWSRHRLESVVRLLGGGERPLQVPAAGLIVALLVNRSTAPERAVTRFRTGPERELVDRAFFAPIDAWTTVLAPDRQRGSENWRLISGWILHEAGRRLGDDLVIEQESRADDGRVFIREAARDRVVAVVARDLARSTRKIATEDVREAFAQLVAAFRLALPRLAAYGLVHERPLETEALGLRLVDEFRTRSEQV